MERTEQILNSSNMAITKYLFSLLMLVNLSEFKVLSQSASSLMDTIFEAEPPFFLTPFLDEVGIIDARLRARVRHSEMYDVESYSGYFTVNKEFNSNLFFWYFPSKANPSTDPLILWLQGEPGYTSLFGLFTGNGPFTVDETNTLKLRNITWVNDHHVLYIDSPVGTGFSFTENEAGYAANLNDVSINLYLALQQFFTLFPELRKNEFYVMGESYAGKYVPALSYVIHQTNEKYNTDTRINLAGLAVGNGIPDPVNQLEYPDYLYNIGLLALNGRKIFRNSLEEIQNLIKEEKYTESFKELDKVFLGSQTEFQNLTGFNFYYNYLYWQEAESYSYYENWVQQSSVRKAIHVGDQKFIPSSSKVGQVMINDLMRSVANILEELLEHYRVILYFGQMDIAFATSVSRKYLQQLKWSGSKEYKNAARNVWFVENELAGYTKCARNLTEVLVRNSGHMVSSDQPLWASSMVSHFTRHESLC